MDRLVLWIAQGFGTGRIAFMPGTFGSAVGILWALLLIKTGSVWWYLLGTLAGLAVSVWLCSLAERILKQKDAPSVVLDEIAALPICFTGHVIAEWSRHGALPPVEAYFQEPLVYLTITIFVLFRIFDIAKVWPAGLLERWPGGWGITADDVMAAVYVAVLACLFAF